MDPVACTRASDWPVDRLLAAKARTGTSIAVVLPALDEQDTVGDVVGTIRAELVDRTGLVDDLLVIDSGSTDRTAERARSAGARVLSREQALPGLPVRAGKGEVLWRAGDATDAELLVFVDADLRDFTATFVTGLLGPLLHDPQVQLVKGCYDRPLEEGGRLLPGGGRVTELVARPLLSAHWPDLRGVVQPLAGEWAVRRAHLRTLHVPVGYGVEIAALIDTYEQYGIESIAQVDLGHRRHSHQSDLALGRMALQIQHAVLNRLPGSSTSTGRTALAATPLHSWRRDGERFVSDEHVVDVTERGPMDREPTRAARRSPDDGMINTATATTTATTTTDATASKEPL